MNNEGNIIITESELVPGHEDYEHFDLALRDNFQGKFMVKMIGEHPSANDAIKWSNDYGELISKILDNKHNKYIRDLVTEGDYEEAFRIITRVFKERKEDKVLVAA